MTKKKSQNYTRDRQRSPQASLFSEKKPQFLRMRYKKCLGLQPPVASQFIFLPCSECYQTQVRLLAAQKPVKRPGWRKGKFALFWMLATGVGGQTPVQRPSPPATPRQSGSKSFYRRGGGGATCRNNTVSSDSHLEIGHRWSDQRHLDCSFPGSVCSHFLETSSQNCGSLCHGYSLVTM